MDTPIWRHRRVWINPEFIESVKFQGDMSLIGQKYMIEWVLAGKPFVGRSRVACEVRSNDYFPVGLMAYLSDGTKERLNLLIRPESILKVDEPLLLLDVLGELSEPLLSESVKLLRCLNNESVVTRVYGSVFWSFEDKKSHLTSHSDLDLLIQIQECCDINQIARKLVKFSEACAVRLDGEFEFLGLGSVSWREFMSNSQNILIKADWGPRLMPKTKVLEALRARP